MSVQAPTAEGAGSSPGQPMLPVQVTYQRIAMPDGVELAAKITRPESAGKFPAILEYNPYRRIRKALPNYRDEYPPVVPYLAERGYAVVQYDVRGTGNSAGWTTDIYSDPERRDGYDMVEWAAAQSWCNGNVGMIGKSYSAVVQWQVAVQNPPHLRAIIVRSGNENVYSDWVYPGGVLRPYMFDSYTALMNAYNFAPPEPELVGEKWSEVWKERLEKSGPWGIGYISHPLDGPYWRDRSLAPDYDRVKCAVFLVAGWADVYATAQLRAFTNLKVPKKTLVGPWGHWYGEEKVAVPGPRIDMRIEYLKWFDYWLKGIENGVMKEPPVTVYVQKYTPPSPRMPIEVPGDWRTENDWPIDRTQSTPLYFEANGSLAWESNEAAEDQSDEHVYDPAIGITSGMHWGGGILPWGMPVDQKMDEARSLTYTTAALESDLEVTGFPVAVLYVSSTADVAYFRVKLIDVAPDGASKLVRYGGLSATHRNSHSDPEPLEPGKVYELKINLKALAYVFGAGHRIRVAIASADLQNAWPTAKPATNSIHRGPRHPSRIVLPVIPVSNSQRPTPDLKRLPNADPSVLGKPEEYSITQDLLNQTTTVRLATSGRDTGWREGCDRLDMQSSFTVSSQDPAKAVLKASCTYTLVRPEAKIQVEASEVTASDSSTFRHLAQIRVAVNGAPHFSKSWSVTVPRKLN